MIDLKKPQYEQCQLTELIGGIDAMIMYFWLTHWVVYSNRIIIAVRYELDGSLYSCNIPWILQTNQNEKNKKWRRKSKGARAI